MAYLYNTRKELDSTRLDSTEAVPMRVVGPPPLRRLRAVRLHSANSLIVP
jgi:hypothetical protein